MRLDEVRAMLQRHKTERQTAFKKAYEAGHTLQEIGAVALITRERVRQIISGVGLTYRDGGQTKRAASSSATREAARVNARDIRCRQMYGCDYPTYNSITGCVKVITYKSTHPLLRMWAEHYRNAKRFNIPWMLTLPEYAKIVTPHLNGIQWRGRIVLGRKEKTGPFSRDNVEVQVLQQSSRITQLQVKRRKRTEKALALKAGGLTIKQIAKAMKCSVSSINFYLYSSNNAKRLTQ